MTCFLCTIEIPRAEYFPIDLGGDVQAMIGGDEALIRSFDFEAYGPHIRSKDSYRRAHS